MRTNVKEHQAQPKKQETKKASANMSKMPEQKNQSTSSKMDSSNKGKGPKGENL